MARRYYSSTAQATTLTGSVVAGTTSFVVASATGFPSSTPYTMIVDPDTVNEEVVEVTARSGTTLTVTRAVDGTTAVSHASGAVIRHGVSARDFDEPNGFLNGSGTAAVAAGTAAAPTIAFSGDTNTGIYSPGADQVGIATAGTARVVVNGSGNVGIGTASPGTNGLDIYKSSGSSGVTAISGSNSTEIVQNGNTLYISNAGSPSAVSMYLGGTERFNMNADGLMFGTGTSLGAWTAYTPTLTGITAGNGTVSGYYVQIGKIIHFRASFVLGSTSSIGSTNYFSLPVTAASNEPTMRRKFMSQYHDVGTAIYAGVALMDTTTTCAFEVVGTNGLCSWVTGTSPFTFATSDIISVFGTYQAA